MFCFCPKRVKNRGFKLAFQSQINPCGLAKREASAVDLDCHLRVEADEIDLSADRSRPGRLIDRTSHRDVLDG